MLGSENGKDERWRAGRYKYNDQLAMDGIEYSDESGERGVSLRTRGCVWGGEQLRNG